MASRLDRSPVALWWWTVDRWFLAAFLSLMGLGIVLSFAASPAVAERIGLGSFHFATRQIIFTIPALAVMIAVSFLEVRQIRRMALVMLCIMLVMMVAVLFIGVEVKGARGAGCRWPGFRSSRRSSSNRPLSSSAPGCSPNMTASPKFRATCSP